MIEHTFEGCDCPGKRCPDCKQVKCYGAFHRDRQTKSGLRVYCQVCQSARKRVHRQNNLEDYRARGRAEKQVYREANREQDREYQKAWRQNHPGYYQSEHVRAQWRAYYETHREQYRERNRSWQQNHPEWRQAINRAYYEANPEKYREQHRVRQRAHPEYRAVSKANRRARERDIGGSFTIRQWEDLKASYDYTCLRCGRQEPDITLTVDHVVPVAKGGTSDIDNIQPLCLACNKSKGAKIIDYRS